MSESLSKDLNLNALFIGDNAENGQIYKALLNELVDEHLGWRQNYMPSRHAYHYARRKKQC